jgi:glyoxylase-like metal-dependent hydrolase (beta-lactamase superfamily II)
MVTLPTWCSLIRADNPGPMTLEGTNTYVLRASREESCVVVDPGPLLELHLEAVAARGPVVLIVLTHGHPDHAEGADRFRELTGAPVAARDPRLCRGGADLPADGDVIGVAGLRIEVVDTPGHTSDSVSLVVEAPDVGVAATSAERGLLTGDTILGRGTTVVAYPDGTLGAYLDSLERLRSLGPLLLLPGHGPLRPDSASVADDYLAHRRERLAQVQAAVTAGASTAMDVVRRVYADVDPRLWPAAELSVKAQLDYLQTTLHHPHA